MPILDLLAEMTPDIRNNYFPLSFVFFFFFFEFHVKFIQKLFLKAEFIDVLFPSNALCCFLSRKSEVFLPYTP